MNKDNLFVGSEARKKLMDGVRKVSNAVGATMGTSGSNSLIECIERPGHYSTNDGYSVANAIKLNDPLEEIGHKILLEAINRANKNSGDGSSTTCVLTSAILEEGQKYLDKSMLLEIKKSLEKCISVIEKSLNTQKKEITINNVSAVASIAAEDQEIGQKIQEIYEQIGKDGIIHWDTAKTAEDSYEILNGLKVEETKIASPYMCDFDENGALTHGIRWKNAHIFLIKQKITSGLDFEKIFSEIFEKEIREVVIFYNEIEANVISDLVKTRIIRGFKSVLVKMPLLWNDEWWEDLAKATGAVIIDGQSKSLRDISMEDMGQVKNLIISKEDSYLDGIKDLSVHIAFLKEEGSENSLLRASRLNLKTARYFVGAHSESALAYRRLKVEDAINSASCALENGVVVGGGIALFNTTKFLPKNEIGSKILKQSLKAPLQRIVENAGENLSHIDKKIGGNIGFNSQSGKIENLMKAGIVDATDVVLNAIRNAIGVAATILTIGNVITLPKEEAMGALPTPLTR